MKKILLAIPFAALVGCGEPTPENHCCMEGDCGGFLSDGGKAACLYTMVKDLEREVMVIDLKMQLKRHHDCEENR